MLFIFDMGGVVTNTFHMDTIFKKLNISKEDFMGICKNKDQDIWVDLQIGKISTEEFWNEFSKRISFIQRASIDGLLKLGDDLTFCTKNTFSDVPDIKSDLFRLYFHPSLNEKTVAIIKKLEKKHRVVCGTNTIQSHWETHMERGDYSVFQQTYASNKIGVMKPNTDFFKTIMEAEEVTNPSTVFFTDDRKDNVEAARSLGINAVRFTTAEDLEFQWEKYF